MSWLGTAVREGFRWLWGFRWTFGVPIATLVAATSVYVGRLPDTFESIAVVRVRELSRTGANGGLPEERASEARATVATTYDRLFAPVNLRAAAPFLVPNADPDDVHTLETVRSIIAFDRQSEFSFTVRATSTGADRSSRAVNALLQTFLESERRDPLKRAESTRDFRARQVQDVESEYATAKAALKAFDTEHAETLSTQKEGLSADLARLRTEIEIRRQFGQAAKSRIDFMTEQISRLETLPGSRELGSPYGPSPEETRLETRLHDKETERARIERELAAERTRFTEKWHTVVEMKERLASAQADVDATQAALDALKSNRTRGPTTGGSTGSESGDASATQAAGDALAPLKGLRRAYEEEHQKATADVATLNEQQDKFLTRLAQIPHTEAARRGLEKELAQTEERLSEARKALGHASELAEFFRISDASDVTAYAVQRWAAPAVTPTGPARSRILLSAAGVGALVGYGLTLLRRRFRRALVVTPQDLLDLAPGSLVVSVPLLSDGRSRRRLPRVPVASALLFTWILLCLVVAALPWLARSEAIPLPEWVRSILGFPS